MAKAMAEGRCVDADGDLCVCDKCMTADQEVMRQENSDEL